MPLLFSLPVLLVGAAFALALRNKRASAVVSIASQALACALVLASVLPLLAGAPALTVIWPWPQPIVSVALRVDALSAFFLAWSLPLTLLGSVYAVGYLEPYFKRGRHAEQHFALLNMTQMAFVLIYSVQ